MGALARAEGWRGIVVAGGIIGIILGAPGALRPPAVLIVMGGRAPGLTIVSAPAATPASPSASSIALALGPAGPFRAVALRPVRIRGRLMWLGSTGLVRSGRVIGGGLIATGAASAASASASAATSRTGLARVLAGLLLRALVGGIRSWVVGRSRFLVVGHRSGLLSAGRRGAPGSEAGRDGSAQRWPASAPRPRGS